MYSIANNDPKTLPRDVEVQLHPAHLQWRAAREQLATRLGCGCSDLYGPGFLGLGSPFYFPVSLYNPTYYNRFHFLFHYPNILRVSVDVILFANVFILFEVAPVLSTRNRRKEPL